MSTCPLRTNLQGMFSVSFYVIVDNNPPCTRWDTRVTHDRRQFDSRAVMLIYTELSISSKLMRQTIPIFQTALNLQKYTIMPQNLTKLSNVKPNY